MTRGETGISNVFLKGKIELGSENSLHHHQQSLMSGGASRQGGGHVIGYDGAPLVTFLKQSTQSMTSSKLLFYTSGERQPSKSKAARRQKARHALGQRAGAQEQSTANKK